MRVRNVTKDNDWTFGQSQYNYTKEETAIILDIKMRLKEWYQDCFFALQKGIPWNVRLGSKNQKELLDEDVLRVVRSVEGVLRVTGFERSVWGRRYRAAIDVYTQYSTAPSTITFDSEER